jgi:hypothetical protein
MKIERKCLFMSVKRVVSIVLASSVCMLIAVIAHSALYPKNQADRFNPTETCTSPPLQCWDGYNKEHFKCMTYAKDTKIRDGVVFKAGTKNCYKSVYFNLDQTTLLLFFWMLVWAMVTSRALETMIFAFLNNNLCYEMAIAILMSIPSIWYACAVLFHYLNDRYFPMYYSQLYFTVTELVCTIICIVHLERDKPVHSTALMLMTGTALTHILQLLLDEPLLFVGRSLAIVRNILLFLGDVGVLYAGLQLTKKFPKRNRTLMTIVVVEIVLFHLVFADEASFSFR